jgi:hypothetical protein
MTSRGAVLFLAFLLFVRSAAAQNPHAVQSAAATRQTDKAQLRPIAPGYTHFFSQNLVRPRTRNGDPRHRAFCTHGYKLRQIKGVYAHRHSGIAECKPF